VNTTPDTAAAGNGGTFDPRQAAALLDQTSKNARRKLQPSPPWLLATRAVLVLAALGAVWLTVRGQHPYRGPTGADIPVLIGFIVVNFAATTGVRARATAGVSGPTRFSPLETGLMTASFFAAIVAVAGLSAAGVSFAWYATSVMVIPGLVYGAVMAARSSWRGTAMGAGLVVLGIVGAFAGAAGSWAVAAVGICVLLLGSAAAVARQQRADARRADGGLADGRP
jgi:hypothetical protein